ncbi:MAG: hypothetical protein AAGF66_05590 [Cyanobacteria bacterium P01_H01_bin.119]
MAQFWWMTGFFFPAGAGLLIQGLLAQTWDSRLIGLAAVVLCAEQGRMAAVDLNNITALRRQTVDVRLDRFQWVMISTIVVELVGFYVALVWLGWGALIVLASQVWFHSLVKVELQPQKDPPYYGRAIAQRLPVLMADGIALMLIGLWMVRIMPLVAAIALFTIVALYGVVKYSPAISLSRDPG